MTWLPFLIALVLGLSGDDGSQARSTGAPPAPSGCVTDRSAGDHTYRCAGLLVDARIPAACLRPGCGLILEIHGDTGTGLLADAHVKLRDLGAQYNYVVVMPTGPPYSAGSPGSTWSSANDEALVTIVRQFMTAFQIDAAKVHVTGFSRGGFVTWRLLCDHADLFASAAPGAAGSSGGEVTCFSRGRVPSRKIPISFLMGRTDHQVTYQSMVAIRDAAIARYGGAGPESARAGSSLYTQPVDEPGRRSHRDARPPVRDRRRRTVGIRARSLRSGQHRGSIRAAVCAPLPAPERVCLGRGSHALLPRTPDALSRGLR